MKNQNIWIKRSAIYFYFFFTSIGFASDYTNHMNAISNDRAVKRQEKCCIIEQPACKNLRKLTEDQEKESEAERKVRKLIDGLKFSLEEQDQVFVFDRSRFNIDDFLRDDFFDVLGSLPDGEQKRLFQYLLQDVDPTIAINQLQYGTLENAEWIQSSVYGRDIYWHKWIVDQESIRTFLHSIEGIARQNALQPYFIFPYNQKDDLYDIQDRLRMVGIGYKNTLNTIYLNTAYKDYRTCINTIFNILNMNYILVNILNVSYIPVNILNVNYILDEFYKSYMQYPNEMWVGNIPYARRIQDMVYITGKRYVEDQLANVENQVSRAYRDYLNNIVQIYRDEMMYTGYMMNMTQFLDQRNRNYEAAIKEILCEEIFDIVGNLDVIKIQSMLNAIHEINKKYITNLGGVAEAIYSRNIKDLGRSSRLGILSVALMGNFWRYQKIALFQHDLHGVELIYTTMEEPFGNLSLKFDSTARKSKNFWQPGCNVRDDYLSDLITVLNCNLYAHPKIHYCAEIKISPTHRFPYELARKLENLPINLVTAELKRMKEEEEEALRLKEIHQMRLEEERQRMIEADSKSN